MLNEDSIRYGDSDNNSDKNNNQAAICFQPELTQSLGSFQTLQSRNRDLLTTCTELHEQMATNRQNRLHAQERLSKTYRELANNAAERKLPDVDRDLLERIRQRISDLEEEHVGLHKRYIAQQSQFRQTVRDQRRRLVDSINRTRALTSNKGCGLSLVANIPGGNLDSGDMHSDSDLGAMYNRKSA